ncbi:hypothetical protein ACIA8K_28380 [Catenuloplanes sp. NPDC051500]|uniref:hypothetical protein n=1 Tax=Catenuloplanes sp. NPDC051500 TaxID=3363959 RepID=UPI00379186AD
MFYARSAVTRAAGVDLRRFVMSAPTVTRHPALLAWVEPDEMKQELYRGRMRGRAMYVIPFWMGPLDAEDPKFAVDITDSAYVVASMRIITRMGSAVLRAMGTDAEYVRRARRARLPGPPPCDRIVTFPKPSNRDVKRLTPV